MVTREKSEKGSLKLKIEISGEKWEEAIERSYEKKQGKIQHSGLPQGQGTSKGDRKKLWRHSFL